MINFLEEIMKLLKSFMAAALITTALTGATYAAYDPANQAATAVGDLKDIGLAGPKKLLVTRAGIDAILDARFDDTQGANANAINAKAFLSGVVHGTINEFAGGDEPTKRVAFLAALDEALKKGSPLDLDITAAGFNPGTAIAATDAVKDAVEIFFGAIAPKIVNPRVAILGEAHALGILHDDELSRELDAAIKAGDTTEVDAKVDGFRLVDQIAERKALHDATAGKFKELGFGTDAGKIAAFHRILADEAKTGTAPVSSKLAADLEQLFSDGVIEGDASSEAAIIASINKLAGKVSVLEGALAKMVGKEGQKLSVVQSGEHARVIPQSHDLGGGNFKGGFNF
jgi:hypothetical protein